MKKNKNGADIKKKSAEQAQPNTFKIGFLKFNINGIDLWFVGIVVVLLAMGLVMMFSASYAYALYHDGDSFNYIFKQLLYAMIGLVAMFLVSTLDYKVWHRVAFVVYLVAIACLVLALFYPERAHVHRWIWFGPLTIQPSEIAKLAIILLFADYAVKYQKQIKLHSFKYGILPYAAILIPIAVLLILEPHISGTAICCGIALVMMLIGGTSMKWVIGGIISAAGGVAAVILSGAVSYAKTRIEVWLNPWSDPLVSGWQTIQSLYAIASGGMTGLGLGNSRQKQLYISEPQNDFVFAVVCEELGYIGAIVVIVLFALLVWRGFIIGFRSPDTFGLLLATGICSQVCIQAVLNIAVVTNSIPNTGISLPFFSYGGSSLVVLLTEMGIVLSVSRQANKKTE